MRLRNSSGVDVGRKLLAADNKVLSRLIKVAGMFSCAMATWIASTGERAVSALDSAIVGLAEATDNLGAAFAFAQGSLKFPGQRLNDIYGFGSLNVKEWFKCGHCFLKRGAHNFSLLLEEIYQSIAGQSSRICSRARWTSNFTPPTSEY